MSDQVFQIVLTKPESRLFALLQSGLDDKAIAARFGVPLADLEDHVKSLLRKTNTVSRAELMGWHGESPTADRTSSSIAGCEGVSP